jgi:hypothetical protein
MWIKVWERWAHGENKEYCDYHEVVDKEDATEMIYELNLHHEWSDKFRGCQYEGVEQPPKEWLKKEIALCLDRANGYEAKAKRLQRLITDEE